MPTTANPPRAWDPLVAHLLVLTFSTGLIDALSVLSLGKVFTANMTGNVVFLGFALAGWPQFSAAHCVVSLAAFLLGALLASRLTVASPPLHPKQIVLRAAALESALQCPVLYVLFTGQPDAVLPVTLLSVACLAAAMGARNAIARKLAVPDLTTTVLTLTLTGLAADSNLAGGANPRLPRRLAAALAMFTGAVLGALFVAAHLSLAALLVSMLFSLASALLCSRLIPNAQS